MDRDGMEAAFDAARALRELPAFGSLAAGLERGGKHARATGLWGASGAFLLAALAEELDRPLLAVAPTPEEADRLEDDLSTFLDETGRMVLPFPAYDVLPTETESPEMPVLSARLTALRRMKEGAKPAPVVVAPASALLQPVPAPEALHETELVLRTGEEIGFERLVEWLFERGLERVPAVAGRGEFAVRGGIVDVFPLFSDSLVSDSGEGGRAAERPVRIEFDGERIEPMRTFDPATQRSVAETGEFHVPGIERARALDPYTFGRPGTVAQHLAPDALVAVAEPGEVERSAELYEACLEAGRQASAGAPDSPEWERLLAGFESRPFLELSRTAGEADAAFDVTSVQRVWGRGEEVARRLADLASRLACLRACGSTHRQAALTAFCRDATEEARLRSLLRRAKVELPEYFETRQGRISAGFEFRDLRWAALADHEILGVTSEHRRVRARPKGEPVADLLDLSAGDYVVHATHGIARYLGMKAIEKAGSTEDYLALLFAENVRLYVPAGHAYLVERYVGAGDRRPSLSKIGGRAWVRRRSHAESVVRDIASDLLSTQAERERTVGLAYPPDSDWQAEFEAAFPYEETPDQLAAASAIKRDMERPVPMDRLLAGDVGFGKTEVAARASFKAVEAGRQVAVLVPTTLLCEQHAKTFSERLAEYPVRVESLSRFKPPREQSAVLEDLARGRVDVVIGTHRLLSKDVRFRDLGLIVIDEEHRFGVEHKEKLKRMRLAADVLTLTATPIPRTLHMSLVGLRDVSNLAIPPEDRLSIRTKVCRASPELVRRAVLRELARGGQAYFVHDRVLDIEMTAERLRELVPEARLAVGHGQMSERELESRMRAFLDREVDVLVSTSIIESGLDIPTVNTIFINNADRFGLAELHQLRGRVGRYRHQAYAYLMVPHDRPVSRDAEKRLRAIEEFEELGAGFKLAMRDLEIRGAGNLLGAEQSGHIEEIGYELYCRLLERAVRELRGEKVREPVDVTLRLGWGASFPPEYVSDESLRLEVYRKLARAQSDEEVAAIAEEMRDRFGPLQPAAGRVLAEARVRLRAQAAGSPYVAREVEGRHGRLVFKLRSPNFKKLERRLRGVPGEFAAEPPDGFALHLPADMLDDGRLEEQVVRVLKRLA
jgi:transcription-repair coupling factor (superfamily II helicase)